MVAGGQKADQAWQSEMFRLLAENALDYALFIVDRHGYVRSWSKAAERLLGFTEQEIVGRKCDVFFTPEDVRAGEPQRELDQAFATGRGDNDRWHLRKDGSRFWCSGTVTALWDDAGTLRGFAKIMRDRTELKRSQEALGDALAYAEAIVATVREPLVVLDGDLRVRSANRSFYQTFHVRPEETQGQFLYDLGNGQWDIPELRKLLQEILPQNAAFNDFEVEHGFPDIGKKVMLLNARQLYHESNDTRLILLAIEDVTALRDAERQRREVETRFTEMVKNVRDHSIFLTDLEGNITSWNVAAERIIGYSEAEALGRHFSLIFTSEDIAAGLPERELRQAREEGRAEDERWHVKKGGERFWALGIVTPLRDAAGRLTGFSKILRDMTERKKAHELLQRQADSLRDADRRKDEFLAMLAHELRNPLAPIRNAAQLIRLLGNAAPNLERSAAMVERHVEHLGRLVDDLLDVSRITSGKIRLRKEPVDLAAVVARAVETTRPLIDARGHELQVTLPPQAVWLDADLVRLAQVVANLLTNAAKYTPKGGRVVVAVAHEGSTATLRVRDTGVGIAPDKLASVFDLFTQAGHSLDRAESGLGIGLTLVKSLTELHGGTVEAYSAGPGRGSEFIVRLPVARTSPVADAGPVDQPPPGRSPPRRVLVVDDNVDAADSLGMLLRLGGHDARTVYDGMAALRAASEFRPEVVLLDIGLPGISGYEVARRLRREAGLRDALLVALTGYGQDEDRRQSEEAGFDAHLVKPADPTKLQQLLAAFRTPEWGGAVDHR